MDGEFLHIGQQGDYRWLSVVADVRLPGFLAGCSEVVQGRFVAVTSFDSGSLRLTPELEEKEWRTRGGITYGWIREYEQLSALQHSCTGFDEWFLFTEERDLGQRFEGNPFEDPPRQRQVMAWVNFADFALHKDNELRDMFWQQMEWIRPESYIGDAWDSLNFATTDEALFEQVLDYLSNLSYT